MRVVIIGTGYVGLVTGTCLAEVGHDVTCVDVDPQKVARLQRGETPIYEPGLSELVHKNVAANRLHFTNAFPKVIDPAVIFFALPTPPAENGEADVSYILDAAKSIAQDLTSYTVLVTKSTVPVGTAARVHEVVAAYTDQPFDIVSNPEFLQEGLAVEGFMHPDRIIVGSSSAKARAVMQELYAPFTDAGVPLLVMDESSAEMAKYAANSFLATKVTFMNQIANLCERVGANVDRVREGIGIDGRIGPHFLQAGIGYGGSCFPKDLLALHRIAKKNDYDFELLQVVMEVNARQKRLLAEKIVARYGERLADKVFAVWGLAFKPDTDDVRESPALDIIRELIDRGATIQAYDPKATTNAKQALADLQHITYAQSSIEALDGADVLIIATAWEEFRKVPISRVREKVRTKTMFDGRNMFDLDVMNDSGLTYVSIGRPLIEPAD